jgi:hypothetical protein
MIRQVNVPALAFEKIVREVLTAPLAKYGFAFEKTFHLYVNELAAFVRWRQGVREVIRFGRCVYDDEALENLERDDEVDSPRVDEHFGNLWVSRHFMYAQLIINGGHTDLFPCGKIAPAFHPSSAGKDLWHFTDEADLARRLRDEVLPYLLTGVMEWFDVSLDDELDLIERGIKPYRPPDAA